MMENIQRCKKNKIRKKEAYWKGFTLVEMLIVIVIIGIIAAFAYPSYQQHILRSNRSDAITALASLAISQEKMLALNGKYSNSSSDLGMIKSSGGLYKIIAVYGRWSGSDCNAASDNSANERQYTLLAIPLERQLKDLECQCFYINDTGSKWATGSNPGRCWN